MYLVSLTYSFHDSSYIKRQTLSRGGHKFSEFACSKSAFLNSFRNTIRVSNSFDPDQARCSVGPDLGPDCLQRLSADGTSRQRVKP